MSPPGPPPAPAFPQAAYPPIGWLPHPAGQVEGYGTRRALVGLHILGTLAVLVGAALFAASYVDRPFMDLGAGLIIIGTAIAMGPAPLLRMVFRADLAFRPQDPRGRWWTRHATLATAGVCWVFVGYLMFTAVNAMATGGDELAILIIAAMIIPTVVLGAIPGALLLLEFRDDLRGRVSLGREVVASALLFIGQIGSALFLSVGSMPF